MNFQRIVCEVLYMSTYLCSISTVAFFLSFPAPFVVYINSVRNLCTNLGYLFIL
jgi:hypothetical protein